MPGQVDDKAKKQRSARMIALGKRSAGRFRSQFLGRTMPVLWEDTSGDGLWIGHAANYLRVYAKSHERLSGEVLAVRIAEEYADGLGGEMVKGGCDG
jgi:threonylcarbamoyladenosine tRNA methylthiotransferase MtaB